jgi:glucose/arabinose dehydrogenase
VRCAILLSLCACTSSTTTLADAALSAGSDARPGPDAPPGTPDAPPGPDAGPRPYPTVTLALMPIASGLSQPTVIVVPPGEGRYFVAEKTGTVSIIENGVKRSPPFISLTGLASGEEEGLLGLAFHPGYAANGRVFVYVTTADRHCRVWELQRGADANSTADGHTEILDIPHPATNHNGGNIVFGPDGMLYIGVGDGGGGFGQYGTTRVLTTRLSKLLRIDVDHGSPYQPPADNPFATMDAPEAKDIWLWGLRNPWRWSFDRQTGDLWIGDVGQECWEEIDFIPAGQKGLDLGWNIVEGVNHCPVQDCSQPMTCVQPDALVPVSEYDHSYGNAIIGGYVYRGAALPALQGLYFFADNGTGFVRSFWADAPVPMAQTKDWTELHKSGIATFGEDPNGELLMCSISQGRCWMIVAP